jgi:hypothetical protein
MELAEQMCVVKQVEVTGEVTFKTFVDFFSRDNHGSHHVSPETIYKSYN